MFYFDTELLQREKDVFVLHPHQNKLYFAMHLWYFRLKFDILHAEARGVCAVQ